MEEIQSGKEKAKWPLSEHDITLYRENPKGSIKKL